MTAYATSKMTIRENIPQTHIKKVCHLFSASYIVWNVTDTGAIFVITKNQATTCSSSRASLCTVASEPISSSLSSRSVMVVTLRKQTRPVWVSAGYLNTTPRLFSTKHVSSNLTLIKPEKHRLWYLADTVVKLVFCYMLQDSCIPKGSFMEVKSNFRSTFVCL